jgi:hypothetical protein
LKIKKHNIHQKSCRCFYHTWRAKSIQSNDNFLCIIHDKIDHLKIALPKLEVKNKMVFSLGQLPITLIGMIAHGQVDHGTFI